MADERKCYAGDLGTDQIGKRVRIRTRAGADITATLTEVYHGYPQVQATSPLANRVSTGVSFEGIAPMYEKARLFSIGLMFDVDPESEVTVLS